MRKPLMVLALLGLVAMSSAGAGEYTIRPGDTLAVIARRFTTTVDTITRLNGLTNPDRIAVGQVVRVAPATYTLRKGDTLAVAASKLGTTVRALADANGIKNIDRVRVGQVLKAPVAPSAAATPAPSAPPATYTVRKGDTLAVAAKKLGTTVRALADANGIKNSDKIRVGQVLHAPGASPKTSPAAPAAKPAPAGPAMTPISSVKPISSAHIVEAGMPPTYTVQRGDSAKTIAARNKVTVAALGKANPGVDLRTLPVGIAITLPLRPVWVCPVQGKRSFDDTWGAFRADTGAHVGTDILSPRGTPVVAPVGGTLELRPGGKIGGNAWYVHGDDGTTYYGAHLDSYAAGAGRIEAGQQIGAVGDTGDAKGTPTHLHFEIHPHGGDPVDPFFTVEAWC